ncbi:MucBP domain-containing protein [Enterococcus termitis]|uniref:MucBP domain-containing protein n=1 Tax=Enterococcus termitis TaxID=332950 RepID=A0A1E5GE85_9ENTE|nr:MucBP domain-containing protein [Enterococcus termitis]OEG10560.1 hypothetical protein BCR25_08810 [Enterococcus termitis]OJG97812.1 hypothetical protein RV18_GL003826 [Enterococcus termitis]
MKKIVVCFFILIVAFFFSPLTSEAATQINFYDIVTLTSQEQAEIIKEKPTLSNQYAQYNLVYQKVTEETQPSSSENSIKPAVVTKQGTPTKPTRQSNLPKAGESSHLMWVLYGSGFIAVSLFILYKHKKYSKLLLIIIVPTAIGPSTVTALANGEALIPAESLSLSEGEVKMIEPNAIDGYVYVGYYPTAEILPPNTESKVNVIYVDENKKELHAPQTISGKIGEAYDASTEAYKLSISGYKLNEANLPANAVGVFKEQEQTIVYEYQKETTQQGKVTVRYLNSSGEEIQASEQLNGELGESFQVTAKDIPGFLFEQASGALDGVFTSEELVINLYYTDEVTINIHYIDKWTKQPLTLTSITTYAEYLRPEINDIDDYYFTSTYNGQTYAQGVTVPSDQLTVKVGTNYTLPKEIRFLITKPTGETMNTLDFPNPIEELGWTIAIDSYSNFLFFSEKPEYIPVNYTGVADQISIDVTYEVTYIPTVIPEP